MIKHTGYIEFAKKKANTPKPSHEKSRQYANLPNSFAPAFRSWKCKLHKTEMYRWGMAFQLSGVVVCERRDFFFRLILSRNSISIKEENQFVNFVHYLLRFYCHVFAVVLLFER